MKRNSIVYRYFTERKRGWEFPKSNIRTCLMSSHLREMCGNNRYLKKCIYPIKAFITVCKQGWYHHNLGPLWMTGVFLCLFIRFKQLRKNIYSYCSAVKNATSWDSGFARPIRDCCRTTATSTSCTS